MVIYMTLNTIVKKLFKNNIKQYILFFSSIIFAVTMIGGYGILQFSSTVTNVIMTDGATKRITLGMFAFVLLGTFAFVIYAYSLFLKYKSKEIGIFISLGIKRENVKKIVIKELNIIFSAATVLGLVFSILVSWLSWNVLTIFVKTEETAFFIGWTGIGIALLFSILCMIITRILTSKYIKKVDVVKIIKIEESVLLKKYNQWSTIKVVSEETVNKLTGKVLDVEPDSFIHVISGEENSSNEKKYISQPKGPITLLNPTTKEEFVLNYKGIKFIKNIMGQDTQFEEKDFFVIDKDLFKKLQIELQNEYIFTTYVFNTSNWRETEAFTNVLFDSIEKASEGKWCPNYNDGAIFDRVRAQSPNAPIKYEYKDLKESRLEANRWWAFSPYSRYHKVNSSVADYAIYILLILYICIIAFVSAVMTIGIKILNTMWRDKVVYKNIMFLGVKKNEIKSIVSRQVALIYFVPIVLGTIITLFLFKAMMDTTVLPYKNISFLFTCGLCLLATLIQVILFFLIKKRATKECMNFINV